MSGDHEGARRAMPGSACDEVRVELAHRPDSDRLGVRVWIGKAHRRADPLCSYSLPLPPACGLCEAVVAAVTSARERGLID